jgi:hypothetical protein
VKIDSAFWIIVFILIAHLEYNLSFLIPQFTIVREILMV